LKSDQNRLLSTLPGLSKAAAEIFGAKKVLAGNLNRSGPDWQDLRNQLADLEKVSLKLNQYFSGYDILDCIFDGFWKVV
jgi:hypothetical protein